MVRKIVDKIKHYILYHSYQERKKRELNRYIEEKKRIQSMEKDERDMEYINLKAEYEHRKNEVLALAVSILTALLFSVWDILGNFVNRVIQYLAMSRQADIEIAKVTLMISGITAFFISIIIGYALDSNVKRIRILYRRILMFEEIKNEM